MAFILLIFFAAFSLEAIGTLTSVIGITKFFGLDWIVICLAVVFDIAKLSTVSFLYKEWGFMPKLLRTYTTLASLVLILITSAGAGAYLSSKFQSSMLSSEGITVKVSLLEEEQKKLEARKIQIDQQIAQLPTTDVKGRARLIANFKSENIHLNERINQIDADLPKIKMEQIEANAHAGPITYLASALSVSSNTAMSFIIGMIIFVFDPLAVSLILAGNYMIEKRTKKQVFECVLPVPEERQKGSEVTELPQMETIDNTDLHELLDEVIKVPNSEPVHLELEPVEEVHEELSWLGELNVKPRPIKEVMEELVIEDEIDEIIAEEVIPFEYEDEIEEPLYRSSLNNPQLDKSDVLPSEENNTPILKYYQ